MGDTPIKLVIADDHAAYRASLVSILEAERDFVVIGQGVSADEAVVLALGLLPDIALLDLSMPGGGISAAARITQAQPALKVVFLTASTDEATIAAAQELGARGYIRKGIRARELIRVLRAIQHGGSSWVAPEALPQQLYPAQRRLSLT